MTGAQASSLALVRLRTPLNASEDACAPVIRATLKFSLDFRALPDKTVGRNQPRPAVENEKME